MNPLTGKRVGEPLLIEEQPPLKKIKSEESEDGENLSLRDLPSELLGRIVCFLSLKDVLNFESIFKEAIRYTGPIWNKQIMMGRSINFRWPISDHDEKYYSERARYLNIYVLSAYINVRKKLVIDRNGRSWVQPTLQQVQKLFYRFQGVMERYPSSLGAFLWKDLNHLQTIHSPVHGQLFQKDFSVESADSTPGDLLLKGLSYLSEHAVGQENENAMQQHLRRSALKSLNKVIQEGMTFASDLAIRLLYGKYPDYEWFYTLALASANKGDYKGLERFLDIFPNKAGELFAKGISFPPILTAVSMGTFNKPLEERERLIDEAIKDYKNFVPVVAYVSGANIKSQLSKWGEAKNYSDKALEGYGNNIPPQVLNNAKTIQENYEKLKTDKQ